MTEIVTRIAKKDFYQITKNSFKNSAKSFLIFNWFNITMETHENEAQ